MNLLAFDSPFVIICAKRIGSIMASKAGGIHTRHWTICTKHYRRSFQVLIQVTHVCYFTKKNTLINDNFKKIYKHYEWKREPEGNFKVSTTLKSPQVWSTLDHVEQCRELGFRYLSGLAAFWSHPPQPAKHRDSGSNKAWFEKENIQHIFLHTNGVYSSIYN